MAKKTTKKTAIKGKTPKRLDKLSQTHGKEETFEPTTLDQIWGDDGTAKYSTMDDSDYEGQLNDMDKADIQTHASQVGVIPVDNTELLKQKLMKEFHKHVNQYRRPTGANDKNKRPSSEVQKILREGK